MSQLTAVVIGAGNRGATYANYALNLPNKLKIVGVAEPRAAYRDIIQKQHGLSDQQVFDDWKELAALEKLADVAFITTQDQQHLEPALAFARKRYHILLEKPMAVQYKDCCEIVSECKSSQVILAVCHVLRYTPQAQKVKQLIQSGVIGDVMHIQVLEPIGYFHFAHSYVRGNWHKASESSFTLLTKGSHQIDLVDYWMPANCTAVSSFGSLKYFKKQNKPVGAGSRCMDCPVGVSCQYSAKTHYLHMIKKGNTGWPLNVLHPTPDIENITEELNTGPYGLCVYDCDNNVCDNQVVNLEYDNGATVSFSMVACTEKLCECYIRVFGDKGELSCDFGTSVVEHYDFLTQNRKKYDMTEEVNVGTLSLLMGHGGADFFFMESFVEAVKAGDQSLILTGPEDTLRSHYICFMAEKSRLENRVIQAIYTLKPKSGDEWRPQWMAK